MKFRRLLLLFNLSLLSLAFLSADIQIEPIKDLDNDFIRGADISMLAQIEEKGGKYYDIDGNEKDLFVILKESGVNWIRLRLWHDPINHIPVLEGEKIISNKGQRAGGGNNDTATVLFLAKRAKDAGFKLLLDFHYSDFWADPGKQYMPHAWKDMDADELNKVIYDYTRETLKLLKDEGAAPDMVQIGNELNNGMMWPYGKIWGDSSEEVGGMEGFIRLIKRASKAVRKELPKSKIAIHLADGGDNNLYRGIFDPLTEAGVDFDIIGLSFYPYWHGSIHELSNNMFDLSKRYKKELVVMETAYAFTTEDGDSQGNVFKVYNGEDGGYLPTVQGQATLVRDVMHAVSEIRGGLGVFYWEPAWIPVPGAGWRTGEGSSWENQAMFDFEGKALHSLNVFKDVYGDSVTITPKTTKTSKITTVIGEKEALPTRAEVVYSNDFWSYEEVEWDVTALTPLTEPGTVTLTGKLKNFDLTATLEITYTDLINLVEDNSFESGELGRWKLSDPQGAATLEDNSSNAKSGNFSYKYWSPEAFKTMMTQTFTDIPNGKYTLKCWAMGGGDENAIYLFVRDYGNGNTTSVTINNSGWQKWEEYTLPGIEVTNNQATIGLYIDATAGNWANYDDFEFYLEKDE